MTEKTETRPQQIVREASTLFSRNGYDKVTVKMLADACGITEAALYRHFRSKQDIYTAVLESINERLSGEGIFNRLNGVDDVEPLLAGLANHILDFFTENEDVYRLLLYSALEGHERAKHVFGLIRGRYLKFLVRRLDELHRAGNIIEKNNEITARCFVGMVFDCALGFSLWKGMQGRMYAAETVVANNIPIYVRGLRS